MATATTKVPKVRHLFVFAILLLPGCLPAQDVVPPVPSITTGLQFKRVTVQPTLENTTTRDRSGQSLWLASVATLAAASIADASTSWKKQEANGMLAGSDGSFGAKGVGLKAGISAAWITGQVFALRKGSSHRRIAIINFAVASALGVVAAHNATIPVPAYRR